MPSRRDPVMYLLGLAARARKLAPGAQAVFAAARKNRLHLILLAQDASPNLRRKIDALHASCPVVTYGTKDRLGLLLQRTELGVLGITDPNFADGLKRELQRHPNHGTDHEDERN